MTLVIAGTAHEVAFHQPELSVKGGVLSGVSAKAVYILELDSQKEIFTRNPDQQRSIASVTKLVSSALFYEHASATLPVTIAWSDVVTDGRSGRLAAGQQYQNNDLLFPALLESSNDASAAMYRVAPVDLIAAMNTYARNLQLQSTSFSDASGLDDKNRSTARELGVLTASLYTQYPHIFDITRLKTHLNHINAWMNNNPFAHDETYLGGKHGYTYEANRTATAIFSEIIKTGQKRDFVYVILGSEALQTDMEALRAYVRASVVLE